MKLGEDEREREIERLTRLLTYKDNEELNREYDAAPSSFSSGSLSSSQERARDGERERGKRKMERKRLALP